ncbi:MAG: hypothetical protein HYU99_09190 [Deltaproteobacteria bacterium]|nr:hypothetical protein [Deltaproteobacteria bacterium]
MAIKEILKARYDKLTRDEKEIVGTALVKVNLGVAMPADHRTVAGFIKGTGLVAKSGQLDDIIDAIHQDAEAKKLSEAKKISGTVTLARDAVNLSPSEVKRFKLFDEDSEVTVKDHAGEKKK